MRIKLRPIVSEGVSGRPESFITRIPTRFPLTGSLAIPKNFDRDSRGGDYAAYADDDANQRLNQDVVRQRKKAAANSGNSEIKHGLLRRLDGKLVGRRAER